MKYYDATIEEARAFLDGTKTSIIMPMEPQPDEGKVIRVVNESGKWGDFKTIKYGNEALYELEKWVNAPFDPGDRVAIREPWSTAGIGSVVASFTFVIYAVDDAEENLGQYFMSKTMPDEAVRMWFVPEKVEAKEIGGAWTWYIVGKVEC